MPYKHWGNESWAGVGNVSRYESTFGDGSDIQLTRITGHVTAAAPSVGYPALDKKIRQSLVSVGAFGAGFPGTTKVVTQGAKNNNEVDDSLFMVNVKVCGASQVVIPFDYVFDPPILVPNGRLYLKVSVEPGATDVPDTETHLTVQWK